jgi:hypothetical protein
MKSALALKAPSTNTIVAKPDAVTPDIDRVETGESAETLKLFAAIHKSTNFSINTAHQLFGGGAAGKLLTDV